MKIVKEGATATLHFLGEEQITVDGRTADGQYRLLIRNSGTWGSSSELTLDDIVIDYTDENTGDGPPPIVGNDPPQDLNGDGLYRDIDGDGQFSISDVQILFTNLDNPTLQEHSEAFNFSGNNPDEVTISDVQALFLDFQD